MRRYRLLLVLFTSVLLAVGAGCANTAENQDHSQQSPSDSTARDSTPAGNPCDGSRGPCEVVASTDVDGDGATDNIGVELVDGLVTVRIDTGGEVSTASVADMHILRQDITPSNVFVGAFHITRPVGADIVVDAKFGLGGSELFGVISWDGGPIVVPAPPVLASEFEDPTAWTVPTEGLRVLVRCPAPGSVGVVTTEGDSSYGIPTPGGAYTETVTSTWTGGAWARTDTARIPGQYVSPDKIAKTGTFECEPAYETPPPFPVTVSALDPNIILGGRIAPSNSIGYGETTPETVYFGGSPSGMVSEIAWDSWGDDHATGHGQALYVVTSVADAEMMPVEVVAFDIQVCDGSRAYSKIAWYFPSQGETFNPGNSNGMC